MPAFMEILANESTHQHIGNVESIDRQLDQTLQHLASFDDPDTITDPQDRQAYALFRTHGATVGKVLSSTFREAKQGAPIDMSVEDRSIQTALAEIYGIDAWTTEKVKDIQNRTNAVRLVAQTLRTIGEEHVPEAIELLHQRLRPSEQITEIFRRLGEKFTPESGAAAFATDLSYLENLLVKNTDRLTPEEQESIRMYLSSIHDQMIVLEGHFDGLKQRIGKLRSAIHDSHNEAFETRLSDLEKSITASDQDRPFLSRMTTDPNLIIENMRQCLGCLSAEINNDTNLTFGDRNKFYMLSQYPSSTGSIADEIVFFEPVTVAGQRPEMSFVLDNVYGAKSADVLTSHVLTVIKKYQAIKERFPASTVSVFVTSAAMNSVGMSAEQLQQKISGQLGNAIRFEQTGDTSVEVDVAVSASGDHYIEFGGQARQAGSRPVKGLILR